MRIVVVMPPISVRIQIIGHLAQKRWVIASMPQCQIASLAQRGPHCVGNVAVIHEQRHPMPITDRTTTTLLGNEILLLLGCASAPLCQAGDALGLAALL